MTTRTIFTIIIKVFGLLLILGLLEVIPQALSAFSLIIQGGFVELGIVFFIFSLAFLFYFFIIRLLLFKSGKIIDMLSLEKDFDQQAFEINLKQSTVIQIAIIVLGGLLFINTLPDFIGQIITYVNQKQFEGTFVTNPTFKFVVISGIKLLLGYLLMNNSKTITSWIAKETKEIN